MVLNHSPMKFAFEDHNALEKVVRSSDGVDWTLLRPTMLAEGEVKEVKVFGEKGEGLGWLASVTRKSVANFVVEKCVEDDAWIGKTPVIAN
jgi:hypothetical protein